MKYKFKDVYLAMSFVFAQRSCDPRTKHAAIAIDDDNTVISLGYNAPPRGHPHDEELMSDPVEKYNYSKHAEENMIANNARVGGPSLKGTTVILTGHPCHLCVGDLINAGVKKIIHAPTYFSTYKKSKEYTKRILEGGQLEIKEDKSTRFIDILLDALLYAATKMKIDIRPRLKSLIAKLDDYFKLQEIRKEETSNGSSSTGKFN